MCGLVGVVGKLTYPDEGCMKRLLLVDYWRGKESTGLAAVRNNAEVHIAKIASHPLDLFDTNRFRQALNGTTSVAFLGHNRQATRGLVNNVNAHPFQYNHIVGAHNGTLSSSCVKNLERDLGETFSVDSMAIFAHIAQCGIEETISKLQGAYAITYFNLEEGTFNAIRNSQRPLWYAYNKDRNLLWYASEAQMLRTAVNMEDYKQEFGQDAKGYSIFQINEDYHYSWNIDELKKGGKSKPVVREMKGLGPFWNPNSTPSTSLDQNVLNMPRPDPFRKTEDLNPHTRHRRGMPLMTNSQNNSVPNVLSLHGTPEDPFVGRLTREKFEKLARHGCQYCQADIAWGEKGITYYENLDALLCAGCSPNGIQEKNRLIVQNLI